MNEYETREYNNKMKVLEDLNACKSYEFTAEAPDSEGRFNIRLSTGAPIYVNYWEYRHDYCFYLDHKLQYITHDTIKDIAKDMKTPQNVHKLNARKIKEWVDYLTAIYERAKVISAERVAKVNSFVDEFLKAGGHIDAQRNEFASKNGTMSGEVVKNGIEYTIQVYDNGYISQDIAIHYKVQNSLETFKKLADNKYTAE